MMRHQLPGYGDMHPPLLIAREDEALTHGQVMYGLIKPTKDMDMVESTAAMVNVIPKKRIYRMEDPEEIDLFMNELMKRPLVLQPSAYIGRGLAFIGCTLYTREERWVLLINQEHPKIKSRIMLGIESAKTKMHRGEPFMLEISFNAFLKRVYLNRLTKAALDERFTIIDFEDAEIVIRFPGDRYHRGMQWELKADNKIRFEFEDLLPSDVVRRTVMAAQTEWNNPALRVIMPDELLTILPGWGFEDQDPFEGVEPPEDQEPEAGHDPARYDPPAYDDQIAPPDVKVVGRSKRKANQPAKIEVPIEMHNIQPNIHSISPSSPRMHVPSPGRAQPSRSPNEHLYNSQQAGSAKPSGLHEQPPDYDDYIKNTPRHQVNQQHSPYGASSPRFPHSPKSPHSPVSPNLHTASPRTPTNQIIPPRTPTSPTRSHRPERYDEQVRHTQRTYLTDDNDGGFASHSPVSQSRRMSPNVRCNDDADDGGFSSHSPQSPRPTPDWKYDANYNETGNNRYSTRSPHIRDYSPQDRYHDVHSSQPAANRNTRPTELYSNEPSGRDQHQSGSRPIPPARGFHRYQGSGRSDTSTSDSGFGETDNGHEPYANRYNGSVSVKSPYYNHAFEQDSPEGKNVIVDDIMAKHKALAEKMMCQQKSGHVSNRQDIHSDSNYTQQLQHWRKNINDLQESYDRPDVNFSRSRTRDDSQEETMEESFI